VQRYPDDHDDYADGEPEQTRLASRSGPQAAPSLAALRRARTNREALVRRVVPVGLGALRDRAQAVGYAYQHGLVPEAP
jgi:hypothetical protein